MKRMHTWTVEEKQFLQEHVLTHTWEETTREFNLRFGCSLSKDAVKGAGTRFRIKTGRTGHFQKGNEPANKGKKMSPDTYRKCAPTMFYKGQPPRDHKPVGTIVIRENRNRNRKCVYEKVMEPDVWREKHILEWERHYGPIPQGKMIIFADGDTLNTDISNLVMISHSQHAVMNRWNIHGSNKEQTETAANVASLKIRISQRKKGKRAKN